MFKTGQEGIDLLIKNSVEEDGRVDDFLNYFDLILELIKKYPNIVISNQPIFMLNNNTYHVGTQIFEGPHEMYKYIIDNLNLSDGVINQWNELDKLTMNQFEEDNLSEYLFLYKLIAYDDSVIARLWFLHKEKNIKI